MKAWKLQAQPWLVLIFVLASVVAVPGAILETSSQIINMGPSMPNTGQMPFTSLNVRNTNGDLVPFAGTDQVLVITRVLWNFTADSPLNQNVQLNLGNYYRQGSSMVNGFASNNDSINPGFAVTNFSANIFVCSLNDPNLTPITGTLSMRLVGYLAPNR